ncbi:MAG: hypothetical protein KAJ93_02375 [Methanosarcinales archaeon]|nr:hypothetical protein [Methanosarcinales archaeon]
MKVSTDTNKIILGVQYPPGKSIEVSDSTGKFLVANEGFKEVKSRGK